MKLCNTIKKKQHSAYIVMLIATVCMLLLALVLSSCKGGDGGGKSTTAQTTVSGAQSALSTETQLPTTSPAVTSTHTPTATTPITTDVEKPIATTPTTTDVDKPTVTTPSTTDADKPTVTTPSTTATQKPTVTTPATTGGEKPVTPPATTSLTKPSTTTPPIPVTTSPEVTTAPEGAEGYYPGKSEPYDGVLIASVYGTGDKGAQAVIASGYVQLYNQSEKDVSLAGASLYYKTGDDTPYSEFAFADNAVIPAGGYYLVRAKSPTDFNHENAIMSIEHTDAQWDIFIDNKEVYLVLAPSDWRIEREIDITTLENTCSVFVASEIQKDSVFAVSDLSRYKVAVRTALTDYSGYHLVNLTKTLSEDLDRLITYTSDGRANGVITSRLNEVDFSQNAGVYENAFTLTLQAKAGYTIYYTTDGTDPSDATNTSRVVYKQGIYLADSTYMPWGDAINAWNARHGNATPSASKMIGGYVIKAFATNGIDATPVYTNTYFVSPTIANKNITLMSYSIPVDEMLGNNGFYSNYMPSGSITATRPRGTGVLEVFDKNGIRVGHSNVEIAVSGNGSSHGGMKSLRIYYKSKLNEVGGMQSDLHYDLFGGLAKDQNGQAITSFSRILLRNSGNDCGNSYIRDAFMQRVSAGLYVDTMAFDSVLLFINGEFWGVYNARERYSPEYVESHYGIDKDNVALIENDYSQVHTNTNAPYVVSSGIEGDADSFNEIVSYMQTHSMSFDKAYAHVCSQMDIDSFIDMWVVRLYFNAIDWPENNIKVWRNRNPDDPSGFDTKWHFTLLDLDMGLSLYGHTTEGANIFSAFNNNSVCGSMMRALMQNESFKNKFILRYYEVVNEHFTSSKMSEVFEEIYQERTPLMTLQQQRWNRDGASVNTWYSAANSIRSFIQNRRNTALNALFNHFGITEREIEDMSYRRISFSFNSSRVSLKLNTETVANGANVKFKDDKMTVVVVATAKEGYIVTGISFTDAEGNVKRIDSNYAAWEVTTSGTITVHTKRDAAEDEPLANGTLVAGPTYLFYLTQAGDLYAWGDNRGGILGLPSSMPTVSRPTFVMSDVKKVATTAAAAYQNNDTVWMTAILKKDGSLWTVGSNTCGQLGRNGTINATTLGEVSFSGKIVDVSIGYDHMLIIDEEGAMWGVGSNSYGQLGAENNGGNALRFQKIAENVAKVSGGRRSSVFIGEDGVLYGLGDNRWNKLAQGVGERVTTPCVMMRNVTWVESGEHQVLVVDAEGNLYYAGRRDYHSFQLGNGNSPTMQPVMTGVKKAEAYFDNMVILTEDGEVYVYGLNTQSAIGSGSVTGGKPRLWIGNAVEIASGYGFTAVLTEDGRILIQGDNSFGQAGNGTFGGTVTLAESEIE